MKTCVVHFGWYLSEQGYDPRDFALTGFGGAGPLHANAIGRLISSWPVIIPPGPGVLCAYGDATTRLRNEASQTFVTRLSATDDKDVGDRLASLRDQAAQSLQAEGVPAEQQVVSYEIDIRYAGQGMKLTIAITPDEWQGSGLTGVTERFDAEHEQLFTFALDAEHELVALRAVVQGQERKFLNTENTQGSSTVDASSMLTDTKLYADGQWHDATVYERSKLQPDNTIPGPCHCQRDGQHYAHSSRTHSSR